MRRKAPGEKYKTLTASIPPELYDAFISKAEHDKINKSELVKSLIEAWLSGVSENKPAESYLVTLQSEKQKLQTKLKKIEIAKEILLDLQD